MCFRKKKMCMQFQERPEEGSGTPGAGLKDGLATWVPGIKTKRKSEHFGSEVFSP